MELVRNFDQGEWSVLMLYDNGTYCCWYTERAMRDLINCTVLPVADRKFIGGPVLFNGREYRAATGYNVFD